MQPLIIKLLSQSKYFFVAVGISIISNLTLIKTSQAFISEDIDKLENENLTPINSNRNIYASSKKNLLEDSRNLIDKIDNPQIKTEMLINLALQYYELNQLGITREILNEALETSEDVKDNSAKTLLMIKIASIFIEIKDLETASAILAQALESSEKIKDNSAKATLLTDLASKYQQIGDYEQAEMILAEVDIIVAEIENPPPTFPFEPTPIEGQILLGTNLSFAKDTIANFNIGANFGKRWATDEINLYFKFLNSYDNSRDSGDENRILLDVITQYKHYLRERVYVFGNLAYLQDDFTGNDSRFSYFGGLGFNVWQGAKKNQTLNMQLGIGDLVQNSTIKNKNAPFPVFQYALIYKDLFFILNS